MSTSFAEIVRWEDAHLVAVDKPSGIASQGGEGLAGNNLVDLAKQHYSVDAIAVLHRLDRNVSGLVLLAKTTESARRMSAAFARGDVERVYRAVVRGTPSWDEREIDAPLTKDASTRVVRVGEKGDVGVRDAHTSVKVLERFGSRAGKLALLEVRPRTGRSHQIRVHLAHVGLPIVGDPKYGVVVRGATRPLLHACAIAFVHPISREPVRIEAPEPWTRAELVRLAPRSR